MATSTRWLTAFSEATSTSAVTALNYARALRESEHGLFLRPRPGKGHKASQVQPRDLTNYLLGQVATQASDAPETVMLLRSCRYISSWPPSVEQAPLLSAYSLGEAFDDMIDGLAQSIAASGGDLTFLRGVRQLATLGAGRTQPHQIELSVSKPAELVWLAEDGTIKRIDWYASGQTNLFAGSSRMLVRKVYFHSGLIFLAATMWYDTMQRAKSAPANTRLSSMHTSIEGTDGAAGPASPAAPGQPTTSASAARTSADAIPSAGGGATPPSPADRSSPPVKKDRRRDKKS